MNNGDNDYDIIVLGSGLASSILAGIISRIGAKVLIIDNNSHPRFAIGESMLTQTTLWMQMLGERFNYPEINDITDVSRVYDRVSKNCGQKKSVSFLYHESGRELSPHHSHQLIPSELPFCSDSHFMRSDVDLHMLNLARAAGADYLESTEIIDFNLEENDVTVVTDVGETYCARLLIDGAGYQSPIAYHTDNRQDALTVRTATRALFTHVTGLAAIDELEQNLGTTTRYRHHDGTIHHLFDGGWFWVIPFNNTRESDSTLASIGLTLDVNRYPVSNKQSAEEEFWFFVNQFPTIKKHFENITPVRPWVSTGQLQYCGKQAAGEGWVMLSHAFGFVDGFLSRGMLDSCESIYHIARTVEQGFQDQDFSAQRFESLTLMSKAQFDATDRRVAAAHRSFKDAGLWNTYFNFWLAETVLGNVYFEKAFLKIKQGDNAFFKRLHQFDCASECLSAAMGTESLLSAIEKAHLSLQYDEQSVENAVRQLNQTIAALKQRLPDIYDWGNGGACNIDLTDQLTRELIMALNSESELPWLKDDRIYLDAKATKRHLQGLSSSDNQVAPLSYPKGKPPRRHYRDSF
jgi:tetracycline 7-halogenase / FADH2 O2-dependent halogenase